MKYRLKDKTLQQVFDKLTDGFFSKALSENIDPSDFCRTFFLRAAPTIDGVIQVRLYEEAFDAIYEYNPNDWNPYPEVTPPEGILMRVEQVQFKTHEKAKGITIRKCAIFRKGEWVDDVVGYPLASIENCRFRPWE